MTNPQTIQLFLCIAMLFIISRLSVKNLHNFGVPQALNALYKMMLILSGLLGAALLFLTGAIILSLNFQHITLMLMVFFLIGKTSKYEY
jgi:hypothetical protein